MRLQNSVLQLERQYEQLDKVCVLFLKDRMPTLLQLNNKQRKAVLRRLAGRIGISYDRWVACYNSALKELTVEFFQDCFSLAVED